MAKRSGPSISVKMILTSTLLVLLTVVGFGVLNVLNIRGVYDESTQKRINVFREGIKSKAEANTQLIAASLIEFLAAGQDSSIQLVIDYIGKRDAGLRLVYVLDARKQVITYCRTENAQGCDHTAYPGTPLYERLEREGRLLFEKWWLDDAYGYNKVPFQPRNISPEEVERGCVEARRQFYTIPSIVRRSLDPVNRENLFMFRNFFMINGIHRAEVSLRNHYPLGDASWTGEYLEAC